MTMPLDQKRALTQAAKRYVIHKGTARNRPALCNVPNPVLGSPTWSKVTCRVCWKLHGRRKKSPRSR